VRLLLRLIFIFSIFFIYSNNSHASFYDDSDFDGTDLAALVAAFDSVKGNPNYNPYSDLDFDGRVDQSDLSILSARFGKTALEPSDFPVYFPDEVLEAAIREAIIKPSGDIMFSDLQELTNLQSEANGITDLEGLQYCLNLINLELDFNQFNDLSPIAGLINLDVLTLGLNQLNDISLLAGLVNLSEITLYQNQLSDISPLAGLVNLSEIGLSVNQITDISPLVSNPGVGSDDLILLDLNPLSEISCNTYIPTLIGRGVTIQHDCP
jgi:hypothetical protein